MALFQPVELIFNCGYARVALQESSLQGEEPANSFQEQFDTPGYGIDPQMFNPYGHRESRFERNQKKVVAMFKKWRHHENKTKYQHHFSKRNWQKLASSVKQRHTLSNCKECAIVNAELQQTFPGKQFPQPKGLAATLRGLINENVDETSVTTTILAELQPLYQQQYGHPFTESLTSLPGSQLQKKASKVEKRKQKRTLQIACRDKVQSQYEKTDALTVLSENISLQSYKRMRLAQSFETPQAKRARVEKDPPKDRKHSPNFDNVSWDKENVLKDLKSWDTTQKINWSQFARDHQVPGKNGGQTVKEFAKINGIDVFLLDNSQPGRVLRSKKLKFSAKEVSVPTHRTTAQIKNDWADMIKEGELTLGEPCNPCTITRYTTTGGTLTKETSTIYGRKIPLYEIRKRLLKRHEPYMHLHTDQELSNMSSAQLKQLSQHKQLEVPEDVSDDQLIEKLKNTERTRTIAIWHDHSTLLGHGYILVTVKVLYDTAVFKSSLELSHGLPLKNIQGYIEEPEIHILALSSSSAEDQAGLIPDRVSCLRSLNLVLTSNAGIPVQDRLLFFYGDKPAAQFERGCKQGGDFPCGTCGCNASRMDDLGHCFQLSWKNLNDMQTIAIKGPAGKKPGVVRPFEGLRKEEILCELRERDVYTSATSKKDLQQELNKTLKGIQRVPSLLLTDPTQPLSDLNLQHYQVLDCEPLHDLKGHISNLLIELPAVMEPELSALCKKLIEIDLSKEKKTGFDYRRSLIHLLALLHQQKAPQKLCTLVESLVDISYLLYLREEERTPQRVLRLYNRVWLHFELLRDIVEQPKHVSRRKLYGAYLHAITIHAPLQFQLMNLRSCNAEHEERLFGQAKQIAATTTNRKPESIIPNILLRLQAKQKKNDLYTSLQTSYSKISKEAQEVSRFTSTNTKIKHTFVSKRISSWQGHLQRISQFLQPGEGVWWKEIDDGFEFLDGEETPVPTLDVGKFHFRDMTLSMIQEKNKALWQYITKNSSIQLPTPFINQEGELTQVKYYKSTQPGLNECSSSAETTTNLHVDEDMTVENQDEASALTVMTNYTEEKLDTESDDEHVVYAQDVTNHSTDTTLSRNQSKLLQTKLAKAIRKQLTHKQILLQEMDKLRINLKQRKNDRDLKRYHTIITILRQELEDKKCNTIRDIKQYEHSHYITQNCLPPSTDQDYKQILKQKKHIESLLKSRDFLL